MASNDHPAMWAAALNTPHPPYAWVYADVADRQSHTPAQGVTRALLASDVMRKCWVTDIEEEFVLTSHNGGPGGQPVWAAASGGEIQGDVGADDNRVLRSDGTTSNTIQGSGVVLDDSDDMTFPSPSGGVIANAGVAAVTGVTPTITPTGLLWLDTSGSPGIAGRIATRLISGSDTATDDDTDIDVDASGGNATVTLPTAVGRMGKVYNITKTDSSSNTVTIATAGVETISGDPDMVLSAQWEAGQVRSNNANWVLR
jgi:hypothetical protein